MFIESSLKSHVTIFALAAVLFLTGCQACSSPRSVSAQPSPARNREAAPTPERRPPLPLPLTKPRIVVRKAERKVLLFSADKLVRTYRIGLGLSPVGDKVRQGDRRTPVGDFYIFTKNDRSASYLSLGLSYPSAVHAERGLRDGQITHAQYDAIVRALQTKKEPPQNTALGGDIYIHGNGAGSDWTWGCVALENEDIRELFDAVSVGDDRAMTPVIKSFKIRNIEINPPLVLSPMAGVTDISFRRLLKRRGGIGLTVSEFISVEGLTRNNPKSKRQMRFYEAERPFAVQIFGAQAERMRMAAEMAEEVGADILDVNCGCPAPKVVKHGGGSGLLKDHPRMEGILKEIKKAITIPMTVKIRAGYYDHAINAIETAKLAEACGAEHISLHGRTREQGYRGLANWDLVREIKKIVSVPVSGSGDITSVDQAFARFRDTDCDGVLIGRGAMANPWIFRQIEETINGREPFQPTLEDKRAVLLEYFEMLREDMPEIPAIGRMKQLAGQFTRGLQGGALFRTALYHSHSVEEILDRITEYFEAIGAGDQYFGEAGKPREIIDAPELDSCEAASVAS